MANTRVNNTQIESKLNDICTRVTDGGGFIHSNIEFQYNEDSFSVHKLAEIEERHFIKVPHNLLIPYHEFDIDIENGDIVIAGHERTIDKQQIAIFEDVLSLYNDSNKIPHHYKESPWLNFHENPEAITLLLKARTGDDVLIIQRMLTSDEYKEELALFTFFKSRMAHCRLNNRSGALTEVFMPLIEFLNHHPLGAGYDNLYNKKNGNGFMAIAPETPVEGSNECYTCYGHLDALDSYINYGFVNSASFFARSIPIQINVPGLGRIMVRSRNHVVPFDKRPDHLKNLGPYLPNITYSPADNKVILSHLIVPTERAPHSLKRVVHEVLLRFNPDIDDTKALSFIEIIENSVIQANIDYYKKLETSLALNMQGSTYAVDLLKVIKRQANIVQKYSETLSQR